MNKDSKHYIPLIVTVGQVVIFPYYIIWLKQVSFSYTLFAWLFALFSFAAAWGYRSFQSKKRTSKHFIPFVYLIMGTAYLLVGLMNLSSQWLPYAALFLQILLGFLQGYFRAWHSVQKSYRLHVANHYLLVGFVMIGLSFIKVVSPAVFLSLFGVVLVACGGLGIFKSK